ncbi:CBASS cGAMP-activated phospholipase [Fredinandcohnia humi]
MKMLCIDGGGIRGVFSIAILHAIEKQFKRPVAEMFELLAGTSTGSIIAASAALKISMGDVLEGYIKYGKKIFVKQSKVAILKSVYSEKFLRRYLQKAFGNVTLADISKPLLIPAVDITHGKPFVHRSNYGDPIKNDHSIMLWDAVLSSCSAPMYFPPNNINNHYLAIDGGLWANNPSLVCITEAIDTFQKSTSEIRILSLGTGLQEIDFSNEHEKDWGIIRWLPFQFPSMRMTPKLLDLTLNLLSESITYHCTHLLGENYLRINKELGQEIPFDDLSFIEKLIDFGDQAYIELKDVITAFIEQ